MARILIIDADHAAATRHKALLEHAGYDVRACGSGAEAIALMPLWAPSLILLDTQLPAEDGHTLLRRLAGEQDERSPPVIVLTARGNPRDIARGFEAGASDYVIKPIPLQILTARVATHLRLAEVLRRLSAANADLSRLSELKGRMVSVVSHELRTPLTSIRGALELVARFTGELPPRSQRLMAICLRNTDRLIRLVNGVLTFARLEAGLPMRLEPVVVEELVSRALEEVQVLAEDRGVALEARLSPQLAIEGDADRVHQVLTNLLSNAIRHAHAGTAVMVSTWRLPTVARFEVQDKGDGIALEDQPRLFLPFSQVESGRASPGGTGLGLSISREIVERHGGRIGVDSGLGAGSTFWFEIPLAPDEPTSTD